MAALARTESSVQSRNLAVALLAVLCVAGTAAALPVPAQSQQVPANPSSTLVFEDQTSNGTVVRINSVNLSQGGFVAIHDASLAENNSTVSSVIGVSQRLSPGPHQDVVVELYGVEGREFNRSELATNGTLTAMTHFDSNDNQEFDFVQTNGSVDGPYFEGTRAVTQDADVSVRTEDEPVSGGELFGVGPLALVGALLVIVTLLVIVVLAVRRR